MTSQEKRPLDIEALRREFPILDQRVHDRPLVYLDNAATTHKPRAVIDAISHYYEHDNSNVHRGVHTLSQRATSTWKRRATSCNALSMRANAKKLFLRPAPPRAINTIAHGFARAILKPGDEVLITGMEHHANIVPWQQACEFSGATLQVATITDSGELDLDDFKRKLSSRTKIAAFTHVSNALGTINPIADLIAQVRAVGAAVLIDGAQAIAHTPVDVQKLDCDFYVFSGHKLYAPTGTGVLYGKRAWLERLPVYQTGGDMIRIVTFEKTTFAPIPHKFEAGTPHIAGIIGLGAAINYLTSLPWAELIEHEHQLLSYATERALQIPGLKIIGTAANKAGGAVVHARQYSPARYRYVPRFRRCRRARGSSLCDAGDAAFRCTRHRARVVRDLQHDGRSRCADCRRSNRFARPLLG